MSIKKGQKLVCVPCGTEVVVDACGAREATIWCCGKPMKTGAKTKKSRTKAKVSAKKKKK